MKTKTRLLYCRVSVDMHDMITKIAKFKGVSVSEFVREAIYDKVGYEYKRMNEVKRIQKGLEVLTEKEETFKH